MCGLFEMGDRKRRGVAKTLYGLLAISLMAMLVACGPASPTATPATIVATEVEAATAVSITAVASTAVASTVVVGTALPALSGTLPPLSTPPTAPTATSIPPLPSGLSPAELKYRILDQYPNFFFCDPDYYPVARSDELGLAKQRFPEIQADAELFDAILAHNNLSGLTSFSDDQILAIYRDYKKLNAVILQKMGDAYQFNIRTGPEGQGFAITGTIDGAGAISEQQRSTAFITCPICLAKGTMIDTPHGPVAVEEMGVGMPVWTSTANGERVAGVVLKVARVVVPDGHPMVQLKLEDGRELSASPGHPTTDGRTLSELLSGELLDGSRIIQIEQAIYHSDATYDILPSGPTGFYWANGILIGSTLARK